MNSSPLQRQPVKIFLLTVTVLLVVLMAGISIIYITTPRNHFTINQNFLGWIGWATLTTSTFYISFTYKKECLLIFSFFLIFGYLSKAYLEPISDQVDHLHFTHQHICRNTDTGGRLDVGLWQYTMNSLLLCESDKETIDPEVKLFLIDILHGLYIAFASTILYCVSRNSGLPAKWSFLSVIIAILFMGTNRFSYFRYYSYGPSFTSLCIYWLWISAFFFSKNIINILYGVILFIPATIILLVNHMQESVFLTFILFFWLIINLTEKICLSKNDKKNILMWGSILFSIFFLFPQLQRVQNIFHSIINFFPISIPSTWENNRNLVYYWNNIHIMGKIWIPHYRVMDTIGLMGFIPLILSPLLFFCKKGRFSKAAQKRIILLGTLPFLIYCTPLCHYLWVAHVQAFVYYRIAYISLFWIIIAYFLYLIEIWILNYLKTKPTQN